MDYEKFTYRGVTFAVYEELDYFVVVVDDESYMLDSVADVREFIQYYNYYA